MPHCIGHALNIRVQLGNLARLTLDFLTQLPVFLNQLLSAPCGEILQDKPSFKSTEHGNPPFP